MCGLVGYCSRRSLGFSNPSTCCRRLSSSLSLNFFILKKVCAGFKGAGSVEKPTSPASPHQPLSPRIFFSAAGWGPSWGHQAQGVPALLLAPAAGGGRGQASTRLQGIPHGYTTGVAEGSTRHVSAVPEAASSLPWPEGPPPRTIF